MNAKKGVTTTKPGERSGEERAPPSLNRVENCTRGRVPVAGTEQVLKGKGALIFRPKKGKLGR